ncbi:hypothetical protein A3844_15190 [Paenibacillus helianthi]|uniref:AtpZ/AtpI family protein n=1 Tax=Paenibacillus helianthi TaxID=1349432 RepID=A0ABX3EPL1_9BACL|nr:MULTISPECIES: AtpZ/AtpI family protein [Paenibacillus]OKP78137.1 hypothetical protein A3842_14715 [Paenibacillus sp. P3E]OKP85607.1 hypothetical protein A3848_22940 [Paenibacillus sp. P32E]OKP85880.1 hypothetical protein A3844_15190 [Paenibacillus helianthi]
MKEPGQSNNDNQKLRKSFQAAGLVSAIGIDLAGCTIGGYLLGRWLGNMWGNLGLWVGIGVLFGLLSGAFSIVSLIKKVTRDTDD